MPVESQRLTIGTIPAKYDRTYLAHDRDSDAKYEVNLARLQCTCPDFESNRAGFAGDDARRVCAHIFDKLYSTKVERTFDAVAQLFIRYGRSMYAYRIVEDAFGVLVVGQPFGPHVVRAIGVVHGKPVLATYNVQAREWSGEETELGAELSAAILARMRTSVPDAFKKLR